MNNFTTTLNNIINNYKAEAAITGHPIKKANVKGDYNKALKMGLGLEAKALLFIINNT